MRAAAHRKATLPQRAAERIKLEVERLEELEESGAQVTGHKGLTYAALAAKCQEEGEREELPTLHVRTWDKTKRDEAQIPGVQNCSSSTLPLEQVEPRQRSKR